MSYDVSSLFTNVPLDETIEILADRTLKDHWFNTTYDLNLIRTDLVDLLSVATKGNFYSSRELYTNRLMTLLWGSHSSLCFLTSSCLLSKCNAWCNNSDWFPTHSKQHPYFDQIHHGGRKERHAFFPWHSTTDVRSTNTGLLLHYQSHVDNCYKRSLLTTVLDRAHRSSSSWTYFSNESDRLKKVLFIRELKPILNVQSDSIRVTVFL